MPAKIFISYRRDDDPSAAARVRDGLIPEFGQSNLFIDVDNLRALLTDREAAFWGIVKQQVTTELRLQRHRASSDAKVLQRTLMRCSIMFSFYSFNNFLAEQSKYPDISFSIFISGIQPKLIELIRRCFSWIEPDIAAFGFAEFGSICLFDELSS